MSANKNILTILLCISALSCSAQQGYKINLSMPGVKDSLVYLAHYYGKNRPTIFKTDSARIDKNGNALLRSNNPDFTGGIYILYLSDLQTNFEVLLNKGDNISITAPKDAIPNGIHFRNSPENTRFSEYIRYLRNYSEGEEQLKLELAASHTTADTATVRKKGTAAALALRSYRQNYAQQYPGTLLSGVFNAMETPQIPEGTHLLEDGKTKDSTFAYRYYKTHFWDGFNFSDDRLIYTPLYDSRLEEYFSKLVLPWPDSMKHEADILLKKTKGTKDMFHYTLWWITRYAENSKVMGMDEFFVYLVENYYMKGDAFWLKSDELSKYIDRAQKIAPNVIGNIAPGIKVPNVKTGREENIYDIKAKYTLILFYSPTCGHCEHEIPLIDSVYEAALKEKGVHVFTIATEGTDTAINNFLSKHHLDKKWTNTWDPRNTGNFREKYDVYSTPTIYLLDEQHIIRGKRLDHSNIPGLINMLEKNPKTR